MKMKHAKGDLFITKYQINFVHMHTTFKFTLLHFNISILKVIFTYSLAKTKL